MYLFGMAKAVAIQEEREPLIGTLMFLLNFLVTFTWYMSPLNRSTFMK